MKAPTTLLQPLPLLQRYIDWPERLAQYIERHRHAPFKWGSHDCATFAAGAVHSITGAQVLAHLPGRWRNPLQAERAAQRWGGMPAALTALFGPPVPALQALRGSIVCVPIEGRPTLGVLAGNGHWCAPGATGLQFRPQGEATHAWRV